MLAVEPIRVGPGPEPGSARRRGALLPSLCSSAPTEWRKGRCAHTRGAPVQAGLSPAGSCVSLSPPLLGANRVA